MNSPLKDQSIEVARREALFEISESAYKNEEKYVLQLGLEWAEKLTKSSISFLHFVNDDQETIELVTWSKRTLDEYCHVDELETHYPISDAGVWADSFHEKAPVIVNDYSNYLNKKGLPEGHAFLGRFISLPIIEGNDVRVLLGVGNKETDYSYDDVQTVQMLADYLWRIVSRKRIQKKLEAEVQVRRDFQSILDRSPAVAFLWESSEGWPVKYVTNNVSKWGYAKEDFEAGKIVYASIIDPRDLEKVETETEIHMNSGAKSFMLEYRIVMPDGSVRWIDERTWVRRDEENKVTHLEGVCMDITNKRAAERQLIQAQKSEALGNLAGGIAHDFNNMLLPIIALAQITETQLKENTQIATRMGKIIEAGKHAQNLVSRLMDFSRAEDAGYEEIDIIQLIKDLLILLDDTISKSMKVEFVNRLEQIPIIGNQAQLKSVFINIVKNASDAMEGGNGFLRISTSLILGRYLPVSENDDVLKNKNYLQIDFKDNGCGMNEKTLKRIFDPFFTTKGVGEGTGMGLAMSYSIITSHKGYITVNSQPNKGSTFSFFLPIAECDFSK